MNSTLTNDVMQVNSSLTNDVMQVLARYQREKESEIQSEIENEIKNQKEKIQTLEEENQTLQDELQRVKRDLDLQRRKKLNFYVEVQDSSSIGEETCGELHRTGDVSMRDLMGMELHPLLQKNVDNEDENEPSILGSTIPSPLKSLEKSKLKGSRALKGTRMSVIEEGEENSIGERDLESLDSDATGLFAPITNNKRLTSVVNSQKITPEKLSMLRGKEGKEGREDLLKQLQTSKSPHKSPHKSPPKSPHKSPPKSPPKSPLSKPYDLSDTNEKMYVDSDETNVSPSSLPDTHGVKHVQFKQKLFDFEYIYTVTNVIRDGDRTLFRIKIGNEKTKRVDLPTKKCNVTSPDYVPLYEEGSSEKVDDSVKIDSRVWVSYRVQFKTRLENVLYEGRVKDIAGKNADIYFEDGSREMVEIKKCYLHPSMVTPRQVLYSSKRKGSLIGNEISCDSESKQGNYETNNKKRDREHTLVENDDGSNGGGDEEEEWNDNEDLELQKTRKKRKGSSISRNDSEQIISLFRNDVAVRNFISRYLKEHYEFVDQESMDRKEFSDTFKQHMVNIHGKTQKTAKEFVFLTRINERFTENASLRGGWTKDVKLVYELMKEVEGNFMKAGFDFMYRSFTGDGNSKTGKYKLVNKKKIVRENK